ncbi:MAG: 50S ribosomal protein L13 [bacterium]|nr:50S ribosomal protein L13 [bacterium]
MKQVNKKIETYEIDAKGRSIGRIASEVATLLLGKNKPDYTPNQMAKIIVNISNLKKVKISPKKLEQTVFYRHSGYPGGLKTLHWNDVWKKNPQDLFMKVVSNMIPNNRHKSELLKKIKFT